MPVNYPKDVHHVSPNVVKWTVELLGPTLI